ncbi:VOC family protein [Maribellus maritimus]|uniref:VOC family protein n=1 Tax=Maribellus maritimus TaxID=2870838 RepID=UPI001EE9E02E|nr:VOC family protein [Maribellus maritimus]MCG6186103.1 VOC family protein [Maribellus maritimus]
MSSKIKYVHTNIVAANWRELAAFYIKVFDCIPILPERNLSGNWLDQLTGLKKAGIRGIHLQLPGFEKDPTLEIFEYSPENLAENNRVINRAGFAHIAFHVEDVEDVLEKLVQNGGEKYGELIKTKIEGVGILNAVYTRDPEGNIVEIQHWENDKGVSR